MAKQKKSEAQQESKVKGLIVVLSVVLVLVVALVGWEVMEGTGILSRNVVDAYESPAASVQLNVVRPAQEDLGGLDKK